MVSNGAHMRHTGLSAQGTKLEVKANPKGYQPEGGAQTVPRLLVIIYLGDAMNMYILVWYMGCKLS